MKKDIHPKYYPEAKVKCDCGAEFTIGSTVAEIRTEICYKCNPLYTGEKRIVDTAGRVEKFQARAAKTSQLKKALTKKKKTKKSPAKKK